MTGAWSPGALWLANGSGQPAAVLRDWAGEVGLAHVPVPEAWRVVETGLHAAMEALSLIERDLLGPVLVYPESSRAWLLTTPDTTVLDHAAPRAVVRPIGWTLRCPAPEDYAHGRGWLEKPDGSGELTDPVTLAAALLRPCLPAEAFG